MSDADDFLSFIACWRLLLIAIFCEGENVRTYIETFEPRRLASVSSPSTSQPLAGPTSSEIKIITGTELQAKLVQDPAYFISLGELPPTINGTPVGDVAALSTQAGKIKIKTPASFGARLQSADGSHSQTDVGGEALSLSSSGSIDFVSGFYLTNSFGGKNPGELIGEGQLPPTIDGKSVSDNVISQIDLI